MKVSWVFDVISPFSYLAFPRLVELPAHVQLECVPVLLAGLLKHFGQAGPARSGPAAPIIAHPRGDSQGALLLTAPGVRRMVPAKR